MKASIIISYEKKLVGKRMTMSFANFKPGELWSQFLPKAKEINNKLSHDLISMTIYQPTHFADFHPTNEFEKWAAVEVTNFENVPLGMETFVLPRGLYAVFDYIGLSTDHSIYEYLFGTWLPASDYLLDKRPHFEVLGTRYRNNDPLSEEEIWIPIKAQ
jgi:AraC family transcriptional regulator